MIRRSALVGVVLVAVGCRSAGHDVPAAVVPVAIDIPAAAGALAPNLANADGAVLATWLEPVGDGVHRLRLARWERGAWSAPVTIVESKGIVANWADIPIATRGGDGALVAVWNQGSGAAEAYDAMAARSTDGGATWKAIGSLHADRTPAEHGFVSLVPDANGVRAFWLDGRNTGHEGGSTMLRTAHVADAITEEVTVDDRVCDCCATSASQTKAGPLVAYRDRSGEEIRDIATALPGGTAWAARGVTVDGWHIAGCPVNGPATAASGDSVVVVWYTYAGDVHRVRAAFSRDGGTRFGPAFDVDTPSGPRAPLGRVGVVLAEDGTAIASWVASMREDATINVRRIASDGRLGAEVSIASTDAGRSAGFPRIARSGADLIVAWTDPEPPSHVRAARLPIDAVPAVAARAAAAATTTSTRGPGPGTRAPAIAAVGLDGAAVDLASMRGKVVLLNLWATWCEPCRAEMPELAALDASLHARGFAVVGLDVDRGKSHQEIASFAERRGARFAIWLDTDDRVSAPLGADHLPVNLLIGRDGTIVWRRDGAIHRDDPELLDAIERALTVSP